MNNQFKFMTDMLQQVDRVVVPECDFDKAMLTKRPIVRAPTHEVLASVPVDLAGMGKPSAVKGLANVGPRAMHVTISDNNEQERIEERNRKERLLKENALPAWMTESSVPINNSGTSNGPTSAVASFEADPQDTDMMPAKRVKLETADTADGGSGTMSFKMEEEEESDFEFEDVV